MGVDLDAAAIGRARQAAERLAVRPTPRFLVADATDLPLEDNVFNGAIMRALLSSIAPAEERTKALREAHRILKPGGRLLIAEFAQTWRDPMWRRRYLEGESLTGELGTFAVPDPHTGRRKSYSHHFSEEELVKVLTAAGFQVSELHADGLATASSKQVAAMAVVAVNAE
jgi:ubiquinone/menaquinone biosynthesis C-methylase UbiE